MMSESGIIAKMEVGWAVSVNVFTNLPKTKLSRERIILLSRSYNWIDATLVVRYPEHVGVAHETLLLGLLVLAAKSGQFDPWSQEGSFLREVEGRALERDIAKVSVKASDLLAICGLPADGKSYERLARYLEDLSLVHLKVTTDDKMAASTILGFRWDRGRDEIKVNLCWRLAAALCGDRKFAAIDLNERHTLTTDTAKVLHRWLSAHLWNGKEMSYKLDTLAEKCWREPAATASSKRWRKAEVIQALGEIGSLSKWTVKLESGGKVIVKRM